MFDFIKKFFAGIAAFFGGLFGGKKAQEAPSIAPQTKKGKGYFLELDETGNTKPAASAKSSEAPKVESSSPAKAPEPVKAAVATLERPKAEAKKPEPAKTSPTSEKAKVKIEAQPNPPAPANNGKAQSDPTFAPNYLLPTASNSRRRPGPNMDMFRDMARQVKTPN